MNFKNSIQKLLSRFGYRLVNLAAFEKSQRETWIKRMDPEWLQGVQLIEDRSAVLNTLGVIERVAEIGVGFGDFTIDILEKLSLIVKS